MESQSPPGQVWMPMFYAFWGGEAGEDAVVEIDEGAKEQGGAGPEGGGGRFGMPDGLPCYF